MIHKSVLEVSEEKRKVTFKVLGKGRIYVITGNFGDPTMPMSAAKLVAPETATYPIFAKRLANKMHCYEIFSQSNVALIDLQSDPIRELTPLDLLTESALHRLNTLYPRDGLQPHPERHLHHRP
jgi:hypothetical protein